MDRIQAMRIFALVAAEGSFTKAAQRLETSPQLVSKYVAQLEDYLKARLLNRSTRHVSLTEVGTQYYLWVQEILQEIEQMESQIGDWQQEARGHIRISAPVSFSMHHLSQLVTKFQHLHPKVTIDLQLNDRKLDLLQEGFDIALRIGELKNSSLIARYITPIRVLMCASPDYLARMGTPTKVEDLKNHRYLRYTYTENENNLVANTWFTAPGRETPADLISNNGDFLMQAGIQGAGIIIQPSFITSRAIAQGQLKILLPELEPKPLGLYAVYAHRKLLPYKIRCFLDFIDGYFGNPPYWDLDCGIAHQ